jgi:hypothetical protein
LTLESSVTQWGQKAPIGLIQWGYSSRKAKQKSARDFIYASAFSSDKSKLYFL